MTYPRNKKDHKNNVPKSPRRLSQTVDLLTGRYSKDIHFLRNACVALRVRTTVSSVCVGLNTPYGYSDYSLQVIGVSPDRLELHSFYVIFDPHRGTRKEAQTDPPKLSCSLLCSTLI